MTFGRRNWLSPEIVPYVGRIAFRTLVEYGCGAFHSGKGLDFESVAGSGGSGVQETGETQRKVVSVVFFAELAAMAVTLLVLEVEYEDGHGLGVILLHTVADAGAGRS